MGFPNLRPILQRLLDSGQYSDLTISCEGQKFQVHRAIVCSQSSFFDAAVKGGFKEASLSHVDLPDDELATIQRVVSFLYLQDYKDTNGSHLHNRKLVWGNDMEPLAAMWDNLGVFMAADKFDISSLKNLARSRIMNWIEKNARRFPLVVQEIWITIPPFETELRDVIINSISYDAQEFLTYSESMVTMTDIPDITIAVLKKTVEKECALKLELQQHRKRVPLK